MKRQGGGEKLLDRDGVESACAASATASPLWSTPMDPSARLRRFLPMPHPTSRVRPSCWRRRFHWYGAWTGKRRFHHLLS